MEGDKIILAAGVTVAAVVGAFVFWGPTGSSRLRQRRGQIAGLHNFGQTCFLNTLLQALAACPQFIAWLQLYNGVSADKKSLITSLLNTLEVINGTHATLRGDPYSPGAVIRALSALGWVIPEEEHDTHELFHVLLASCEEEVLKPQATGCLSDALPDAANRFGEQNNRPSSALLSDFLKSDYDESTSLNRLVRSEAHTPDSPASVIERDVDKLTAQSTSEQKAYEIEESLERSLFEAPNERSSRSRYTQAQLPDSLNKRNSSSCRSLERLSRGPGRVSIWSDKLPSQVPHPFQGAMGHQMLCHGCGFKTAVRYDKFDSVTLNLPAEKASGLSLGHLLGEYINAEEVSGVKCEACHKTTVHTKSLTFAKLPACLCIHISRTVWLPTGQALKRQDYIHFPESMSMAPYSSAQPHLGSHAGTPWGSSLSLYSTSLPLHGTLTGVSTNDPYSFGQMFPKNLYRLLAVVVHSGEANSGHFVTYRRGALRNGHRWFYTSDTIVREVTVEEVLSVPAYMLFYDRSPQKR